MAISNYQTSIGNAANGRLTNAQRDQLLSIGTVQTAKVGAPAFPEGSATTPANVVTASLTQTETKKPVSLTSTAGGVTKIQNALNVIGFDAGTADGKLEGKTVIAIMGYQKLLGAPQTGKLTVEQTDKLLSAATLVNSSASTKVAASSIVAASGTSNATTTTAGAAAQAEAVPDLSDLDTLD